MSSSTMGEKNRFTLYSPPLYTPIIIYWVKVYSSKAQKHWIKRWKLPQDSKCARKIPKRFPVWVLTLYILVQCVSCQWCSRPYRVARTLPHLVIVGFSSFFWRLSRSFSPCCAHLMFIVSQMPFLFIQANVFLKQQQEVRIYCLVKVNNNGHESPCKLQPTRSHRKGPEKGAKGMRACSTR